MLRESAIAFGYPLELRALIDPSVDPGVPHGRAILTFVLAILDRGTRRIAVSRQALLDAAGPAAVVDTAAVFGNFEMMNRVAEGTGIPVGAGSVERLTDIVEILELTRFAKR